MITQTMITTTGIIAIWLVNDHRATHRRYACIIGLVGQPFWLYSAYTAGHWGVFILSMVYTVAWGRGLGNDKGQRTRTSAASEVSAGPTCYVAEVD